MKKIIALFLILALVFTAAVACQSTPADDTTPTDAPVADVTDAPAADVTDAPAADVTDAPVVAEKVIKKVALVTDVGTIDDESFNQACWQGVVEYCDANGIEYTYYQPEADNTDARVLKVQLAVSEGANVIVMPGYMFGETLLECQDVYPDVYFVAVDVAAGDLTYDYATYYDPSANAACITFSEEQAGYLAGYAAVKDGYTKLGFLGGMAVPAVIRYGYGYVQGCDAAAKEIGANIEINYTYGGQFYGDANITAKMEGWYAAGTEIVFACGGGIYTSAVEAALNHNAMVIGVDVDQNYIGKQYSYNPFLTSAMKALQNSTVSVLTDLEAGNFANWGGKCTNLSLAEGDYVGLPTAEGSWAFKTFTVDEYNTILAGIVDGTIVVSNATDVEPTVSEYTTVNYIA